MRSGDLIADRFEVELLAGSGGVGQVYRARDRLDGGRVALKVLKPPSSKDTERFAREVKVLSKLNHPSIVRYVAHGKTADGEPYLAMEWLDGEDLAERLAREPLTVAESVDLVRRAAEALASAHSHGVVHRDIKPSNLFLRGGRLDDLKVLDFGLAWLVDASRELTRSGLVVGTLGYMAPEQALGERLIDARADVFALGCVLYRCITGHPPFDSDRIGAVLMKILHEEPARMAQTVPGVPAPLDDVVARMLAKEPANRPANGAAAAEALAAILPTLSESAASIRLPPLAAITHTERKFACFVAVAPQRDAHTPEAGLLVLFDAGTKVRDKARAVAERYGGQFEALADGSLLVTMSGGTSATDLASQAARCALALRDLLPAPPIAVAMGRSDQTSGRLVSAAIDAAAEMLGPADSSAEHAAAPSVPPGPPSQIHIDGTTAGLLDPIFDVGGDAEGLVLLGERPAVERPRLLLGKPTPCVGRERELAALQASFDECAVDGVARVALVTGPPGCGKSRVRRELLRTLRERREPTEIWLAVGQPLSNGAPFSLVAGLVRSATRLSPEDPPAVRRAKLLARVQRNIGPAQAARVAAFLGEITQSPFTEEGDVGVALRAARADTALMAEQVRRAWQDLLSAECAAQPVVLALEDLQWGDLPSVGLILGAVRRMHEHPLFVVGFARDDVHDVFPKLARDAVVQEIRLGELTPRASTRLLRSVVGDRMSSSEVDTLVERAGGNPFYLEELLRAAASGRGFAVPETVLAMVQARLAALDQEARRVLRAASIFGSQFQPAGVRALLGAEERGDEVQRWFDVLVEAEMIEHPSGIWEETGELAFRHMIVREAVYETLSDADRRLGHKLAGEWLSGTGKGDASTIARHFTLGGEPARAAAWHLTAAEAALPGGDFTTAMAEAARGIACGAAGELLGALYAVQLRAHVFLGDPQKAEDLARETIALLPPGSTRWCQALGAAGVLATLVGRWDRLFGKASAMFSAEPEPDARDAYMVSIATFAQTFFRIGMYDRAEPFRERLESLAPVRPGDDAFATAWLEAVHASRAGTALADPWEHRRHASTAASALSAIGDWANAGSMSVQACSAMIAMGDWAEASRQLRETITKVERAGASTIACTARAELARALCLLGEQDEARAQAAEAVQIASMVKNGLVELETRRVHLQVAVTCGDRAAAEIEARALLRRLTADTGSGVASSQAPAPTPAQAFEAWTLPQAEAALALAQLHFVAGRTAEALEMARAAMAWLDAHGGMGHLETQLRLVYADALDATGQSVEAATARARARARLLERAEKIEDLDLRASFLEKVPENVRVLETAVSDMVDLGHERRRSIA